MVGLLPDKVVVGNVDDSLAKLEVDMTRGLADVAVNKILIGVGGLLGRREGLEDLIEDGARQRADGIATVKKHSLTIGLVEHRHSVTVLLGNCDTIKIYPIAVEEYVRNNNEILRIRQMCEFSIICKAGSLTGSGHQGSWRDQ